MTWTKLGDEFGPESSDLTNGEFRTHVEALIYSNWRLLDLYVPKSEMRRFASSPTADADVDGLVAKAWWMSAGRNWYIGVRFAEWQRDKAQVEARRAYLAAAQKRSRKHKAGDHSLCFPVNCKVAKAAVDAGLGLDDLLKSTVDSTVDPGRDGSGRGALRPKVKSTRPAGDLSSAAGNEVDGKAQPTTSVAISQDRRDHNGSIELVHDAQQNPADVLLQSPATGGNAREACENCGHPIGEGKRPDARYCSSKCKNAATKRRARRAAKAVTP